MPVILNLRRPYGTVEADPDLVLAIFDAIEETRKTGLEHGFNLCLTADGQYLKASEACQGTKCNIGRSAKCPGRMMEVGNFHTHPSGGNDASPGDLGFILTHSTLNFPYVGCRADAEHEEIRCDRPDWLPTSPFRDSLDGLFDRLQSAYDEWARTGEQPQNGRWLEYEMLRALLVDGFPPSFIVRLNEADYLEASENKCGQLQQKAKAIDMRLHGPFSCDRMVEDHEELTKAVAHWKERGLGPVCAAAVSKSQETISLLSEFISQECKGEVSP